MHQFSSLLSFYTALVESDLPEVEKWSACIGINAHFSNGDCSVCQFFEQSLANEELCEVPSELSSSSRCNCIAQVNECNSDEAGITPLHVACSCADLSVVQFLLERGAAVNAVTVNDSYTPLQVAVAMRPLEYVVDICRALVSYGSYIHVGRAPPLCFAIQSNSPSLVAALLSAKLRFPDTVRQALSAVDEYTGYTPLHFAVRYGYFNCCQLLIDAGADVNALCQYKLDTSRSNVTPLELAVVTNNKDIVELLLQSPSCQVDMVGSRKATALLHATSQGNADIVKALLSAGANTEVHNEDDFTPLLLTVFTGRNDIAKLLIDGGANVNSLTSLNYSALHHAAWDGNVEMVRLLLDSGARDDDRTDDGNTPLALAAHGACDDVLDLLIRRGCNVNNADKDMDTPLLYTVHNGDKAGCKLLMDNGASCGVRNRAGMTITWAAAYCGHHDLLHYLLVHGNPPLSVPSRGLVFEHEGPHPPYIYDVAHTPLYVAIKRKRFDIAELLLSAGVMMYEEHWCWNSSLVSNLAEQSSLHNRLTMAMSEAPSLRQIVRHYLRRHFGDQILIIVPVLEIPKTLQDYLLLRSLEKRTDAQ